MKVNNTYQNREVLVEIKEFFEKEAFIQLNSYLSEDVKNIKKAFSRSRYWEEDINPLIKSRSLLNLSEEFNLDVIQTIEYFKSKEFLNYLEEICQISLNFKSLDVVKYKHKDFQLLNDLNNNEDVLEVYFDLTPNWEEKFGGTVVYTTKEEEILYLEPQENTLTILYKPEEIMKYMKYINNKSKNNEIIRLEIKFDLSED